MKELLEGLARLKRLELRDEIEKISSLTALEYSKSIFSYKPAFPIEPMLLEALEKELKRLDYPEKDIGKIIENLNKHRVIQTFPHLVLSYGPRTFCADWLASLSVPPEDYYIVGMYSGVPFSNDFWPGHLTFNPRLNLKEAFLREVPETSKTDQFGLSEKRVSVIPSKIQDELVFRSDLTEKTRDMVKLLIPKLQPFFDHPALFKKSYSKWALESTKRIVAGALKKENLVYLDINEVASNYLVRAFKTRDHIMYKIMFDPDTRQIFQEFFDTQNLFLNPYLSGKFPSQEGLSMNGDELVGKHTRLELQPDIIIDALMNKRLCPGLLLTFTIFSFLSDFKCLGSFRQLVYLPEYKKNWIDSGLLDKERLGLVPVCNPTTGFFADRELANIRPIDIILGMDYNPDQNLKVAELILSVKHKLLE